MITYWGLVDKIKEIKRITSTSRESNDELYDKLEELYEAIKEEN